MSDKPQEPENELDENPIALAKELHGEYEDLAVEIGLAAFTILKKLHRTMSKHEEAVMSAVVQGVALVMVRNGLKPQTAMKPKKVGGIWLQ